MTLKLNNGQGDTQPVRVGLVDSEGMFLYLMDDQDTQHYRFSSESELLTSLREQRDKLMKSNDKKQKRIDRLEKDCKALEADLKRLLEENIELRQAVDGSA